MGESLVMHQVMGPFLAFEGQQPLFWLSFSMEKDALQTLYFTDYENTSESSVWKTLERKENMEIFYVYDVSAESSVNPRIFCLIFMQSKVYRIIPIVDRTETNNRMLVNQVERLQFNGNTCFYHIDPFYRAYDATTNCATSQPGFFIKTQSFPQLSSIKELHTIQKKHALLQLPPLPSIEQPLSSNSHPKEVFLALELTDLLDRLNNPQCLLLTQKPDSQQENVLCLWLEDTDYHYEWSLNKAQRCGKLSHENSQLLIDTIHTLPTPLSQQDVHDVLKQKKLIQNLVSECFTLSLHQQKLIVARMSLDGIWPEKESITDPKELISLFLSFINPELQSNLSSNLLEISKAFHEFIQPRCLASIATKSQFYDPQDQLASIANKARLSSIYQFIYQIVFFAIRQLDNDIQVPEIPSPPSWSNHSLIGVNLEIELADEASTFFSPSEVLVYQMIQNFHYRYTYQQLTSIINTIDLLLNRNPCVESLASCLYGECEAELQDEGHTSDDWHKDILERMRLKLHVLISNIHQRSMLLFSIVTWNEVALLDHCQSLQDFIYILNQQKDEALVHSFLKNNQASIIIKLKTLQGESDWFYGVYTSLINTAKAQFRAIFLPYRIAIKIKNSSGLAHYIRHRNHDNFQFFSEVITNLSAIRQIVRSIHGYQCILHELFLTPSLASAVIPYLAQSHQKIFSKPDALHHFLSALHDNASTWWLMLDRKMQIELLSYTPVVDFLSRFDCVTQENFIGLIQADMVSIILQNTTIKDYIENCNHKNQLDLIHHVAAHSEYLLPTQVSYFKTNTQRQLLYHHANKIRINSFEDLITWLESIAYENQDVILKITASHSLFCFNIEQLYRMLSSLDSRHKPLVISLASSQLIALIDTMDKLSICLCYFNPLEQVHLVQLLQAHRFEQRAIPWLSPVPQRTQLLELWLQIYQHIQRLNLVTHCEKTAPIQSPFEREKISKRELLIEGLEWLSDYLIRNESPHQEPTLLLQTTAMQTPLLKNLRIQVDRVLSAIQPKQTQMPMEERSLFNYQMR